jgi:hypothetical protein
MKNHSTVALPTLYASECWTIGANDKPRIAALRVKFMQLTSEYTWMDHKVNEDIFKELKSDSRYHWHDIGA